jgi:hypothetical protein
MQDEGKVVEALRGAGVVGAEAGLVVGQGAFEQPAGLLMISPLPQIQAGLVEQPGGGLGVTMASPSA